MKITIDIPDAKAIRVIDGICGNLNYQPTIRDADDKEIPNPETKNQFAKRMIIQMIKDHTKAYERKLAEEAISSSDIDLINIS